MKNYQLVLITCFFSAFLITFTSEVFAQKKNSEKSTPIKNRLTSGTNECPPNLDFEFGDLKNWESNTGIIYLAPNGNSNYIIHDNSTWIKNAGLSNRHEIIDRNTLPANDYYGGFPVNPPFGGGRYAIKLGSDMPDIISYDDPKGPLPNARTESVRYEITIPNSTMANEFSILFSYAVVFEDPTNGPHDFYERPSFRAFFYEPGGDTTECLNFNFVATSDVSGFTKSPISNPNAAAFPNYSDVLYRAWTPVFVNLSKYPPGTKLYVEFTTTDCTKRGHFSYAYVDVIECNYKIKAESSCNPSNKTILEGPDGLIQKYEWKSGDFNTLYGVGKNLVLNQALPNNSKVNLILTSTNGARCIDTIAVRVNNPGGPVLDLGTDKLICNTQSVQIGTNPVNGYLYQWSPALGLSNISSSIVTASPAASTTYSLTLTDPVSGCTVSDDIKIDVAPPVILSVNSGNICPGKSLTLSASGADFFSWTPATGLSSTSGSSVIAAPLSTTNYSVTGTNSSTGCKASVQSLVTVQGGLNISGRSVNPTTCQNGFGTIIISGLTPNAVHLLNYEKNSIAQPSLTLTSNTLGEIYLNNLSSGSYNKLSVNIAGCFSNLIGPFNIISLIPDKPVLSSRILNFCAGDVTGNISFTTTGGAIVKWTNSNPSIGINLSGSGNISSFMAINNTSSPISADIKVRAILNGCSSEEETLRIIVNPKLVISVNSPSFCKGQSVQLTASGADTYTWSPSTGLNSTDAATVTASPSTSTIYTVTGINNTTNCRATTQSSVTVLTIPNPTVVINSNNSNICEGSSILLTAAGGNAYQWYLNSQPIPGAINSTYQATQAGTYTLEAIADNGCKSIASIRPILQLLKKPKAEFNALAGCIGRSALITNLSQTDQSGSVSYRWDLGDGSLSTSATPVHFYSKGGLYTIKLKVSSLSCSNLIDSFSSVVYVDTPQAGIRYPTVTTLINTNTNLKARNFGSSYLWQPSRGLNKVDVFNPIFNYDKETDYLIRISTPSGCITFDSVLVRVFSGSDVFVPSAFSPNKDGVNDFLDLFTIGIRKIHFWVFNRWGQLMFETTDPAQRWDGNFKGKPQPLENYVWIVEAESISGQIIRKRGQTILIR